MTSVVERDGECYLAAAGGWEPPENSAGSLSIIRGHRSAALADLPSRRVPPCRTRGKAAWQGVCLVKETSPSPAALMADGVNRD